MTTWHLNASRPKGFHPKPDEDLLRSSVGRVAAICRCRVPLAKSVVLVHIEVVAGP